MIATGLNSPIGIAIDAAGNIFVADAGSSAIIKLSATTYVKTLVNDYFYYPEGVAVDPAGNIYVTDGGINRIYKIPAGTTIPATLVSDLKGPTGVAADGAGNVYVAEQGAADIKVVKPLGGYFIKNMLPAGLIFNNKTGAITGTPTVSSPAKTYSVTAYNAAGSGSASFSLTVNGSPGFVYDGCKTILVPPQLHHWRP